jgi:hypothetical protein
MQVLTDTLATKLQQGGAKLIQAECKSIDFTDPKKIRVILDDSTVLESDHVVSCISSLDLAKIVSCKEFSGYLEKIPAVDVVVVNLQYSGRLFWQSLKIYTLFE